MPSCGAKTSTSSALTLLYVFVISSLNVCSNHESVADTFGCQKSEIGVQSVCLLCNASAAACNSSAQWKLRCQNEYCQGSSTQQARSHAQHCLRGDTANLHINEQGPGTRTERCHTASPSGVVYASDNSSHLQVAEPHQNACRQDSASVARSRAHMSCLDLLVRLIQQVAMHDARLTMP